MDQSTQTNTPLVFTCGAGLIKGVRPVNNSQNDVQEKEPHLKCGTYLAEQRLREKLKKK